MKTGTSVTLWATLFQLHLNLDKTMVLKIKVGIFIDYFIVDEQFVPFSGG